MSTEIEIIPKWDYETSVIEIKNKYYKWGKLTLELARELYFARSNLANSGYRSDLTSGQNGPRFHTWEEYTQAAGIPLTTAKRWLFLYNAEEDRLMEPEEARERRDQMLELMFREIEKHLKKDPEWRPEGWNPQLERAYRKWVSELNVVKSLEQDDYKQAELFSRENLRLLAQQLQEDPTPEEMLYQEELCNRYERIVTPLVKVEQQISIARLVEKAVTMFPAQARAEVARSVAKVIMDMSEKMEDGK